MKSLSDYVELVRSIALQTLAFRGEGSEPPQLRLRGLRLPSIPAGVKCLPFIALLVCYLA
ncbi:hypothetical protein GJU40_08600 [Bacillus lacus]|uniref:Uncharacterized protein n=1 Tax=Metabacillus lacus TaxID=1983721 RepID=A0A7X2IYY2_9BACI|nr:hypothetical protein [Metabacillus lacus]MRX72209.1 hypothetical protein [Metabacillus lacus]